MTVSGVGSSSGAARIATLQQAQAQQQALAAAKSAQKETGTPTPVGTNSGVQPGTAAEDGSVHL